MVVLVVSTNRNRLPMLPHGACLAAEAAERAGHRVRLLDLMFERDPVRAIARALRERRPDVVGVSVRNIDNNDLHAPVYFLGELQYLLAAVLGGAAVGVMPGQLLRLAEAACCALGDAETVFPPLLERL